MIDPTFKNISRLLVLSFKNGSDPMRDSFDKYYMPLVKIQGFNAYIHNTPFFDQPIKNKRLKNLSKCQETIIIQQEAYLIILFIKTIIKSLVMIYIGID